MCLSYNIHLILDLNLLQYYCNKDLCVRPAFLFGCGQRSPGRCVPLEGVDDVKQTALVSFEDVAIRQPTDDGGIQFISTEVVAATMTGIYSEVSLSIPAGTTFTMPLDSQTSIEVAVVEVSQNLTKAATRLSLRRSENGLEFGILGPVVLLTPSKTTSYPAVAITVSIIMI